MANHVYFNVNVDGDEAVMEEFSNCMKTEIVKRPLFQGKTYTVEELIDIDLLSFMPKGKYDSDGYLESSWDYYVNNVGAKWCYVEELDKESGFFAGYSAWSPPHDFGSNLAKHLEKFGKFTMRMNYEDENKLFVGNTTWSDEDIEGDTNEIEDDEITQWLLDELEIEELPEDFEWWEIHDKLDTTPEEFIEDKIYNWQEDS